LSPIECTLAGLKHRPLQRPQQLRLTQQQQLTIQPHCVFDQQSRSQFHTRAMRQHDPSPLFKKRLSPRNIRIRSIWPVDPNHMEDWQSSAPKRPSQHTHRRKRGRSAQNWARASIEKIALNIDAESAPLKFRRNIRHSVHHPNVRSTPTSPHPETQSRTCGPGSDGVSRANILKA
jgi:hypothetical protein